MKNLLLTFSLLTALATGTAMARDQIAPLETLTLANGKSIVVDSAKRTVYTFDVDTGRESRCYDGCAQAWPPVLVDANTPVREPVSTTVRRDGKIQLSLNGHPLYYFVGDQEAGDVNGDGLDGVWHIIEN